MTPLTAMNIEQSFRLLASGETEFSEEFQAIAASDPTYNEPFAMYGVVGCPVLYRSVEGISCAQSRYLGFYALQRAVRGLLLGVNYIVGGDVLLDEELYGPSVAAYYTAAYHAVHGFLALSGRVFFDSTIWPIESHRPTNGKPDHFIAILTRKNQWKFEPRSRNHHSRWAEVKQVYPEGLPPCFEKLFRYLYRGCSQKGVSLIELIKNPDKYRVQLVDELDDFLKRIAEVRHHSLYASSGSDPHVVEALWNRDTFTERGIDNQAVYFGQFAHGLLLEVATDLDTLIGRLATNKDLRLAFPLSVLFPWFDTPRIDNIASPELQRLVLNVNDWLKTEIRQREKTESSSDPVA